MSDRQGPLKLGYLVSRYPDTSHTFIRREIAALRRKGAEIHTFTVREVPADGLRSEEDAEERKRTWSILPVSWGRLIYAHVRGVAKRPRRYVMTLIGALRDRMPGIRSWAWAMFYFAEAIVLAGELERREIKHLHTHFANAGGDVGYLATRYLKIGWSQTLHGSADFEGTRALLGKKIEMATFTACASHFARAQAMWASELEYWSRLLVVRCGVELSRISARSAVSENHAVPRILTIGRLSPEKGQLGLIEAFDDVIASGVEAKLRIVGEGSERARVEAAIRNHGLVGRVEMTGALGEEQALEEMRHADLFVLTSFMEGLPVVLMEAMATGLPVVAPRVAGIPELVEDKVTGRLFTPGNWEELSSLLKRLLTSTDEREATVDKARLRVKSEFDIDHAVEPLWAKLYHENEPTQQPMSVHPQRAKQLKTGVSIR